MFSRRAFADIDLTVFPTSYQAARQQWLQQLEAVNVPVSIRNFPCAGVPDQGDGLFTDSVWIGSEDAERVVVVLAGTHGIEGFAGSAVQLDFLLLLEAGQLLIPKQLAILLVHALTPWGYANLRRCDADGVDLNRNAVDFTQPLPNNNGYQQLRSLFYSQNSVLRQQYFTEYAQQFGQTALEIAISGGQYLDADGPFYGGLAPAHGRLVCEDLIAHYQLATKKVFIIDIHTGLGPYGHGELICDHQLDSAGAGVARQCFGDALTLPFAGTSSSVPKFGLLDYLWHDNINDLSCFVTLEFGTFSTGQLFEILLIDHQLWAKPEFADQRLSHSQIMRQHFCPDDPLWRELLIFRARQVLAQAIQFIAS